MNVYTMPADRTKPAQGSSAAPAPAAPVDLKARARSRPVAGEAPPAAGQRGRRAASAPSDRKDEAPSAKARVKRVRDSFTMPEADFALIAKLKRTAIDAKREAKKNEFLRAGLRALLALDAKALVAALDGLEQVKPGRPKKG